MPSMKINKSLKSYIKEKITFSYFKASKLNIFFILYFIRIIMGSYDYESTFITIKLRNIMGLSIHSLYIDSKLQNETQTFLRLYLCYTESEMNSF